MAIWFPLIAAAVSAGVSLLIFRWSNRRSVLTCEHQAEGTIVGTSAKDGWNIFTAIGYSGRKAITKAEYEEQLCLTFGANAEVHAFRVARHSIGDMGLMEGAVTDGRRIVLPRMLINDKEKITVRAIVTDVELVHVTGRIENVAVPNRMSTVSGPSS